MQPPFDYKKYQIDCIKTSILSTPEYNREKSKQDKDLQELIIKYEFYNQFVEDFFLMQLLFFDFLNLEI